MSGLHAACCHIKSLQVRSLLYPVSVNNHHVDSFKWWSLKGRSWWGVENKGRSWLGWEKELDILYFFLSFLQRKDNLPYPFISLSLKKKKIKGRGSPCLFFSNAFCKPSVFTRKIYFHFIAYICNASLCINLRSYMTYNICVFI